MVEGSAVFLPPSWQLFPSALGVILVLILFPSGLAGLCYDLRDWTVAALLRRHDARPPAAPSAPRHPGGHVVSDTATSEAARGLRRLGAGASLFPLACSPRSSCSTRPRRAPSTC